MKLISATWLPAPTQTILTKTTINPSLPSSRETPNPFRNLHFRSRRPEVHFAEIQKNYTSALQNLRLIKRPARINGAADRQWSEAARRRRCRPHPFIYSRSPFSMHDLNNESCLPASARRRPAS